LDPVIRNTVGKFSLIADIKHPHSSLGQICCTWISNHITKLMLTNNYTRGWLWQCGAHLSITIS
jgi:hypothetical protein